MISLSFSELQHLKIFVTVVFEAVTRDSVPEEMPRGGGQNSSGRSEQNFTDHTYQIDLKATTLTKNRVNFQLTLLKTYASQESVDTASQKGIFKNSSADRGLGDFLADQCAISPLIELL